MTAHEVEVPMMLPPHRKGVQTSRKVAPPLTANQRLHWSEKGKRSAGIRYQVGWRAKAAKIGPQQHITVCLHYLPGDAIPRDPSNLMPTQKAAVDGLRDAGVVADDTPRYVTELMPVIHPGPGPRRLWLEITTEETQ